MFSQTKKDHSQAGVLAASSLGGKRAEGRRAAFPGAARMPEGRRDTASVAPQRVVLPARLPGKSIHRLELYSHQNTQRQTKARLQASERQCVRGRRRDGLVLLLRLPELGGYVA